MGSNQPPRLKLPGAGIVLWFDHCRGEVHALRQFRFQLFAELELNPSFDTRRMTVGALT
jgi:hypothetical protein